MGRSVNGASARLKAGSEGAHARAKGLNLSAGPRIPGPTERLSPFALDCTPSEPALSRAEAPLTERPIQFSSIQFSQFSFSATATWERSCGAGLSSRREESPRGERVEWKPPPPPAPPLGCVKGGGGSPAVKLSDPQRTPGDHKVVLFA